MGLRVWTIVAAGAVLWLAPQRSRAVISVFTTRAAFNGAAAGPLTTEGFEAMPLADLTLPATIVPSNLVVSRPAGVVSVYVSDVNQFGFVNTTAGSKYLAFGRNPPSGSENGNYDAQFGLPAPANAFAFD